MDSLADRAKLVASRLPPAEQQLLSEVVVQSVIDALTDRTLFEIVRELKEIQELKESNHLGQREVVVTGQNRKREELIQRQALEMAQCKSLADGVVITVIEKNRRERERFEKEVESHLERLDKELIEDLDQTVIQQQTVMAKAGVPHFYVTCDENQLRLQMALLKFISLLAVTDKASKDLIPNGGS